MKTVTLTIPGTPPSFNAVGLHSHWTQGRRHKRDWQERCEIALMEQRVPRGLKLVEASAKLSFRVNRRRDEGNFRVILEKALGDALVNGRWLPDDTPEHYRFGAVEFTTAPKPLFDHTEVLLAYTR